MGKYDKLFEPIQLGPITVPNRLYQSPHACGFDPETEAYFRGEKSKGGFGLVCLGATSVHPTSTYGPAGGSELNKISDVEDHKIITNKVHQYGGKIFCQIWHGGVLVASNNSAHGGKYPGWGPSASQNPVLHGQCKEMEEEDIEEVIKSFVQSAVYAKMAGYDGVEIHAASGYLLTQFLSPYFNKRTDKWGGSLENRARLYTEITKRVKAAIGDTMAVGTRLMVDDRLPASGFPFPSFGPDEALEVMVALNDMIDFWDLNWGMYITSDDLIAPARKHPENFTVSAIAEIRKKLYHLTNKHTPIGTAGRIRTPDDALKFIEEDMLDMVGMARQSIADPHWPRKVRENKIDEIRECIACGTCHSTWSSGRKLACTFNPCAGEEVNGYFPEEFIKAKEEKMILVIGGGVTGMEVASVAAAQGHIVHLHEALPTLGGHTSLLGKLPDCDQWNRLIELRQHLINKRGVKIHLNSKLDAQAIVDYGADEVVFATGATWDRHGQNTWSGGEPIFGWDLPHIMVPEDILRDGKSVGESVLILDSDSYLMGTGLATMLASQGKKVQIAQGMKVDDPFTFTVELASVGRKLCQLGVDILHNYFCFMISEEGALLTDLFDTEFKRAKTIKYDNIIMVTMRIPQTELYKEVKKLAMNAEHPMNIHLTGEAISPKSFYSMPYAIYWAHSLARSL